MKIAFLMTTYNRPASFYKVASYVNQFGDVYVVNDGSDKKYRYPKGIIKIEKTNGGKQGYHQTVTMLWQMVKGRDYDYYFMIPDDMIPVDRFIQKAIRTYNSIPDYKKIALNLYLEESRCMKIGRASCRERV